MACTSRIRGKRRLLQAAAIFASFCWATSAWAAKPTPAEVLFRQGREAADKGDYTAACAKFEEAGKLSRSPGLVLNLADCDERDGHLLSALDLAKEALAGLPPRDDRLAYAKKRVDDLEAKIPKLTIRVTPALPNTRVEIDGAAVDASKPAPVDPGRHEIEARAADRSGKQEVTVAAGEQKDVTIALAESEASAAKKSSSSGMRTAGFIAGGVGVAGILVFGVTAGIIQSYRNTLEKECDAEKFCSAKGLEAVDAGQTLTPINTAALIVGAAGLAAGATFILLAPTSPDKPTAALRVSSGPSAAMISLVGAF